jgi:DNA-binding response OmpR family regulator
VTAKKLKLLCVDDDAQFLNVRGLYLQAFGFQVVTSTNPRQALRLYRKTRFDAAIVDFEMPEMNGAELAREMKSIRANVPVAILSGLPQVPEGAPHFHDRFICKTESGQHLIQEIHSLIASATKGSSNSDGVSMPQKLVAFSGMTLGYTVEAMTGRRSRKHVHPALDLKRMARA